MVRKSFRLNSKVDDATVSNLAQVGYDVTDVEFYGEEFTLILIGRTTSNHIITSASHTFPNSADNPALDGTYAVNDDGIPTTLSSELGAIVEDNSAKYFRLHNNESNRNRVRDIINDMFDASASHVDVVISSSLEAEDRGNVYSTTGVSASDLNEENKRGAKELARIYESHAWFRDSPVLNTVDTLPSVEVQEYDWHVEVFQDHCPSIGTLDSDDNPDDSVHFNNDNYVPANKRISGEQHSEGLRYNILNTKVVGGIKQGHSFKTRFFGRMFIDVSDVGQHGADIEVDLIETQTFSNGYVIQRAHSTIVKVDDHEISSIPMPSLADPGRTVENNNCFGSAYVQDPTDLELTEETLLQPSTLKYDLEFKAYSRGATLGADALIEEYNRVPANLERVRLVDFAVELFQLRTEDIVGLSVEGGGGGGTSVDSVAVNPDYLAGTGKANNPLDFAANIKQAVNLLTPAVPRYDSLVDVVRDLDIGHGAAHFVPAPAENRGGLWAFQDNAEVDNLQENHGEVFPVLNNFVGFHLYNNTIEVYVKHQPGETDTGASNRLHNGYNFDGGTHRGITYFEFWTEDADGGVISERLKAWTKQNPSAHGFASNKLDNVVSVSLYQPDSDGNLTQLVDATAIASDLGTGGGTVRFNAYHVDSDDNHIPLISSEVLFEQINDELNTDVIHDIVDVSFDSSEKKLTIEYERNGREESAEVDLDIGLESVEVVSDNVVFTSEDGETLELPLSDIAASLGNVRLDAVLEVSTEGTTVGALSEEVDDATEGSHIFGDLTSFGTVYKAASPILGVFKAQVQGNTHSALVTSRPVGGEGTTAATTPIRGLKCVINDTEYSCARINTGTHDVYVYTLHPINEVGLNNPTRLDIADIADGAELRVNVNYNGVWVSSTGNIAKFLGSGGIDFENLTEAPLRSNSEIAARTVIGSSTESLLNTGNIKIARTGTEGTFNVDLTTGATTHDNLPNRPDTSGEYVGYDAEGYLWYHVWATDRMYRLEGNHWVGKFNYDNDLRRNLTFFTDSEGRNLLLGASSDDGGKWKVYNVSDGAVIAEGTLVNNIPTSVREDYYWSLNFNWQKGLIFATNLTGADADIRYFSPSLFLSNVTGLNLSTTSIHNVGEAIQIPLGSTNFPCGSRIGVVGDTFYLSDRNTDGSATSTIYALEVGSSGPTVLTDSTIGSYDEFWTVHNIVIQETTVSRESVHKVTVQSLAGAVESELPIINKLAGATERSDIKGADELTYIGIVEDNDYVTLPVNRRTNTVDDLDITKNVGFVDTDGSVFGQLMDVFIWSNDTNAPAANAGKIQFDWRDSSSNVFSADQIESFRINGEEIPVTRFPGSNTFYSDNEYADNSSVGFITVGDAGAFDIDVKVSGAWLSNNSTTEIRKTTARQLVVSQTEELDLVKGYASSPTVKVGPHDELLARRQSDPLGHKIFIAGNFGDGSHLQTIDPDTGTVVENSSVLAVGVTIRGLATDPQTGALYAVGSDRKVYKRTDDLLYWETINDNVIETASTDISHVTFAVFGGRSYLVVTYYDNGVQLVVFYDLNTLETSTDATIARTSRLQILGGVNRGGYFGQNPVSHERIAVAYDYSADKMYFMARFLNNAGADWNTLFALNVPPAQQALLAAGTSFDVTITVVNYDTWIDEQDFSAFDGLAELQGFAINNGVATGLFHAFNGIYVYEADNYISSRFVYTNNVSGTGDPIHFGITPSYEIERAVDGKTTIGSLAEAVHSAPPEETPDAADEISFARKSVQDLGPGVFYITGANVRYNNLDESDLPSVDPLTSGTIRAITTFQNDTLIGSDGRNFYATSIDEAQKGNWVLIGGLSSTVQTLQDIVGLTYDSENHILYMVFENNQVYRIDFGNGTTLGPLRDSDITSPKATAIGDFFSGGTHTVRDIQVARPQGGNLSLYFATDEGLFESRNITTPSSGTREVFGDECFGVTLHTDTNRLYSLITEDGTTTQKIVDSVISSGTFTDVHEFTSGTNRSHLAFHQRHEVLEGAGKTTVGDLSASMQAATESLITNTEHTNVYYADTTSDVSLLSDVDGSVLAEAEKVKWSDEASGVLSHLSVAADRTSLTVTANGRYNVRVLVAGVGGADSGGHGTAQAAEAVMEFRRTRNGTPEIIHAAFQVASLELNGRSFNMILERELDLEIGDILDITVKGPSASTSTNPLSVDASFLAGSRIEFSYFASNVLIAHQNFLARSRPILGANVQASTDVVEIELDEDLQPSFDEFSEIQVVFNLNFPGVTHTQVYSSWIPVDSFPIREDNGMFQGVPVGAQERLTIGLSQAGAVISHSGKFSVLAGSTARLVFYRKDNKISKIVVFAEHLDSIIGSDNVVINEIYVR